MVSGGHSEHGEPDFSSPQGKRGACVPSRALQPLRLRLFWNKGELLSSHVDAFRLCIKELKMHLIRQRKGRARHWSFTSESFLWEGGVPLLAHKGRLLLCFTLISQQIKCMNNS